jgi:hypothetical protein
MKNCLWGELLEHAILKMLAFTNWKLTQEVLLYIGLQTKEMHYW